MPPYHILVSNSMPIHRSAKGDAEQTLGFTVFKAAAAVDMLPAVQEAVQGANKSRSKKGNPFEFLQLLASLTKRW